MKATDVFFYFALTFIYSLDALPAEEKAQPGKLDLRTAVELGLQNNPAIRQAKEKMREGDEIAFLAISKSLPSVSGSLLWNRQKDASTSPAARFQGDPFNYYSAQFQFSQTLLQRGYISALFAGGQERSIRKMDFEAAKRDLIFDITTSFFQVLLYSRQFQTLKRAEEVHRQSLETAQYRHKIGRGQLLDVLQVKTELALLAPRIEKASNDMKAAAAQLSIQLGNEELKEMDLRGKLEPPSFQLVQQKTRDLSRQIPELVKIQIQQEQFENAMVVSLGKHWPELRLNGTIGRTGFKKSDLTDSSANLWTAGLQLNVPIFSGLSYFFEKGSLQSQSLQLKYQEQELRNQLSSNQVKFLQDLRSSESVITYSKAAYELADQSVKEAKRQYKLAAIDYVQFLTTEQKMIDSELALDQARFEYLSLLTKYFRAYGYPPEVLVDSLGS